MNQGNCFIDVRDIHVIFRRQKLFRKPSEIHALKGISFAINKGDSIGVIGRNGAGKSTLLRVLAGIIEPDSGEVINHNANVKMLALGAGIAPECSGLDNIKMQILLQRKKFYSKDELNNLIEKVIKLADIDEYVHEPYGHYSDGMKARLNFAVATQMNTDVLLVDEILSVGDLNFRKKSRQVMQDKLRSGDTVILVSHDLGAVKSLCNKALWIENGELLLDAEAAKVVSEYESYWNKH